VRLRRYPRSRWFYWAIVLAGPLALVAAVAGWITTEVGRQPWIVYGVMRTSQAVTGAKDIPIGYGTLVLVYVALGAAVAWVLHRLSLIPLPDDVSEPVNA
jgi:cytochrome d ubiquinol oxidase subunit I